MIAIKSILAGIAAAGWVVFLHWCSGVNLTVRGVDLGVAIYVASIVEVGVGVIVFAFSTTNKGWK